MKQNTSSGRLRRTLLLGTTAIGLVCVLGVGLPARAADECGTITNGEVFCSPAGNDYTSGITYNPAENLTMVVQDGVTIAPASGNVLVDGSIITRGNDAHGIYAYNNSGNVIMTLSASGEIETEDGHGIFVYQSGDGIGSDNVTVQASGDITTHGGYAHGVHVQSTQGSVVVTVPGSITSYYFGSRGISVENTDGPVSVTAFGTIVTGKYYSSSPSIVSSTHGIYLNNTDGNVTVTLSDSGNITTYGGRADGIHVLSTAGDVSVTAAGAIDTSGDFSSGIRVNDTSGDVAVTLSETGSITTYGPGANGIAVQELSGDVEISASGVITTHGSQSYGMYLSDIDGKVSLAISRDITTYSELSSAVVLRDVNNSDIIVSGSIVTGKNYAGAPTLFAEAAGLVVDESVGYANITLTETSSIDTYGLRSWGVRFERVQDYIALTAAGQITTEGDDAAAIYFDHVIGSVNAVVAATGSIATYGAAAHGIHVLHSTDDVNVTVEGSVNTFGYSSSGIQVNDTSGDVAVTLSDTSNVTTNGLRAAAVSIEGTTGTTTVAVDGDINTHSNRSYGVSLHDNTGDVNVTLSGSISTGINYAGSPSTFVSANGILLFDNDGNARVTLSDGSAIKTQGSASGGVVLANTGGYAKVIAYGDIVTEGTTSWGISLVSTAGDVRVAADGSIVTNGLASDGIFIFGADDVVVTAAGDITTNGFNSSGIRLSNVKTAAIKAARTINTHDSYSNGIWVNDTSGDVDVELTETGSILTHGGLAHGIALAGTGSASDNHNVTLDIAGTVNASGLDADGVQVSDTEGIVQIVIDGSVSGGGGDGAGVALDNPNATSSAITIGATGAVGALSEIAIRAVEPVTISNAGAITGMVDLGDGDDSFTNSGTWYLRNYADFGGGEEDQFINAGTLSLSKGTASLWQGEIVGLEIFPHGGIIDLQDGIAGDTLSISGNFKSDGGSLLLDAVLDGSSSSPADTLILENVSLLSASTKIFVTNAGGLGVLGDTGILLVDADVDDSGGEAFTLGQAVIGAYEYKLHYDDAADAWYLRNLVTDTGSPSIFAGTEEYPALMTAALLSFGADWSALHNRLSDDRFQAAEQRIEPASWTRASAPRLRPWLQVSGARQEITADTAFDQQVAKLTGGVDMPIAMNRGRALIGVFAGTGRQAQDFAGSTSEADSDAALAGLYAAYRSGGFYGNGIVKYEHHWTELHNEATSGAGAPFEIDIWGGSLETGYRFQFERSYVQPRLRLNTAHAASSSLEDASGERIDLEAADSFAGEAAARLGLALTEGEIYLDAGVRHEFLGETQAVVSTLSFSDALPGTSGFVSGGLLLRMLDDKVLLSLEGGYARGAEGEELTANAALRMVY